MKIIIQSYVDLWKESKSKFWALVFPAILSINSLIIAIMKIIFCSSLPAKSMLIATIVVIAILVTSMVVLIIFAIKWRVIALAMMHYVIINEFEPSNDDMKNSICFVTENIFKDI